MTEDLPEKKGATHLANRLIRSGTAPALNYGEALSAESRKDFIHNLKVCLKELRESAICLKIILRRGYAPDNLVRSHLTETTQLISILVKSIQTAQKNLAAGKFR